MSINTFWTCLEGTYGIHIPIYVQNIMHIMGYDNPVSFQRITPAKLKEIEGFMRSINFSPPIDARSEDYFGIFFAHERENFSFTPGDKDLILGLVDRVKEYSHVFKKLLNY
ncbi:uncharacterized protein LOC107980457 [Nasonia vitripennis]|uniref:Uncharacterized protein n=1 Tax=Nasonia vitripennis TaxID=7425 RepID=A0A7M7G5S0_NASVI|nr:uncharacterized protein LOC107980457 [Nasonia vitripennis]